MLSLRGTSVLDPRDVATLVLRYFSVTEYAKATDRPVRWDRPVIPLIDDLTPTWYSADEWGIPGRKPVGYAHPDSLVRVYTLGDVGRALEALESEDPASFHTLREELAPPVSGAALDDEWKSVYRVHREAQEARAELDSLVEAGASARRQNAALLKYHRVISKGTAHLARKTHAVLNASQALIRLLPARSWN